MKKITRILCFALCLAMLVPAMVGCASKDSTYGAQVNMYLTSEVYNFDPAYAHLDSSAVKLLGLLFEGIMKLDAKGNTVKALCDKYEYVEDEGIDKESKDDDTYTMTITLKESGWSDGRAVSADDFVFAWKRLLEPDFDGEGAELLYDIKGAWERKNMGMSPDDIHLYGDKLILTIEFAHPINPDEFLTKLTSIALVPLRRDVVDHYYNWSSASTTIQTNGPFSLLTYNPGSNMELARNTYYRFDVTDKDAEPAPYKNVKPYKIVVDFKLNAEDMMKKYEEGQLFYISELPANKEIREQYKAKATIEDTLCSHMYYFNTAKAPFDNVVVRQVLAGVIDRNAIVDEIVFAKPSTGIIPDGIKDLTTKDSFAQNNENKLSSTASMTIAEAKSKLSAAGINPASFGELTLTVRVNSESSVNEAFGTLSLKKHNVSDKSITENTVDVVVANKIVELWKQLGFNFKINYVGAEQYKEITSSLLQYRDIMVESLYGTYGDELKYNQGNDENVKEVVINVERCGFDVIALDYQMLDLSAFSALSVYNPFYSGSILGDDFATPAGHFTGYNNEAYNKLIKEADEARISGDKETLSKKLHEAEKLLLEEVPCVPLFVYQNATLISKDLSGIKFGGWGYADFAKLALKNWKDYLPTDEAEEK